MRLFPMRSRRIRIKLLTLILFAALAALGAIWAPRYWQARVAGNRFERAWAEWEAQAVESPKAAGDASEKLLRAELALPTSSAKAAHTRNVRRLGEIRLRAEGWYVGANDDYVADWRDVESLAARYTHAVERLRLATGDGYVRQIDGEFDFPFRKELGP